MTSPTLAGVSLGTMLHIDDTKNGNIIPLPIPGSDADATEVFDMLGVTRTIQISGMITGTRANIITARNLLLALINGDQSATVSLVIDEIDGTGIDVKVASIRTAWDFSAAVSNKMDYTIMVIQGV